MLSTLEPGCWIDGHWGQYATAVLVDLASQYNYDDPIGLAIAKRHLEECTYPGKDNHVTDEEFEILVSSGDQAEFWLNEAIALPGFAFGWHDGEFFYEPFEWWEDND